jgi:hypothetical protein
MHKYSLIENGFVKGDPDTAVESASICQSEGELNSLNCPAGVRRVEIVEFVSDPWYAVAFADSVCSVVNDLHFDKAPVRPRTIEDVLYPLVYPSVSIPI